jgi:hypothetical protein
MNFQKFGPTQVHSIRWYSKAFWRSNKSGREDIQREEPPSAKNLMPIHPRSRRGIALDTQPPSLLLPFFNVHSFLLFFVKEINDDRFLVSASDLWLHSKS